MNPEEKQRLLSFESIADAARNRLVIAGIGLIAALGAAKMSLQSEPARAAVSAEATISALEQDCEKVGLIKPEIEAKMIHPGKLNQKTIVEIDYDAMPVDCHSVVRRANSYQIKLQNPKKPKRWFTIQDWSDSGTYVSNEEGGFQQVTSTPYDVEWTRYQCSPGKRKTKVFVQARNRVQDLENGKTIGEKSFRHNVQVKGAC